MSQKKTLAAADKNKVNQALQSKGCPTLTADQEHVLAELASNTTINVVQLITDLVTLAKAATTIWPQFLAVLADITGVPAAGKP